MGIASRALAPLLIVALGSSASAGVVTWEIADGGNGHAYEYVPGTISWNDALSAATGRVFDGDSGHLATLTSQAEHDFVLDAVLAGVGAGSRHIGGYQPEGSGEPGDGWSWITGEAWNFTAWKPGEPSNNLGLEHVLEIDPNGRGWNDGIATVATPYGYVVEYDPAVVPLPPAAFLGFGLLGGLGLTGRLRKRRSA